MNIAIFGAGGQGRTVAECLRSVGIERCKFLDDSTPDGTHRLLEPGFLDRYEVIVAIGDNLQRKRVCDLIVGNGGRLKTVIHRTAYVSDGAEIGAGCAIHCGAHIGPRVKIGEGCIINNLVSIGHDCSIGDYVNICDGTTFGGKVVVGDQAFVGLNTIMLPKTKIGRDAYIGAGSVVVQHVPDGARVAGNPARPI